MTAIPQVKNILWRTTEDLRLLRQTGAGTRIIGMDDIHMGNATTYDGHEIRYGMQQPTTYNTSKIIHDTCNTRTSGHTFATISMVDHSDGIDNPYDSQKLVLKHDLNTSTVEIPPADDTIHMARKVYRPPLQSEYIEPDVGPDLLDGMELLYKNFGKSLRKTVVPLPVRDDVIIFDPNLHDQQLETNLKWNQCPDSVKPEITTIIKDYWDVFCEEGLRNNIRGFMFRVGTGDCKPVCCKAPRYGPHEEKAINELVRKLEDNGLIEDDFGPWGAQIVLAAKANQDGVSYKDYQWRLCVSYRRLNAVTRPFAYPIPRCDDAVTDIGPDGLFFLTMDLDSGYWQISVEAMSRDKLAFFT